jgi:hypothetical protein
MLFEKLSLSLSKNILFFSCGTRRFLVNSRIYYLRAGLAQWYSTGLGAGWLGFESRQGLGIFLFASASRPALGPTQPPIQWISGALSLVIKRPGREADHSPPSSAEVKNAWGYTSTPPIRLHGMVLSQKSTGTTLLLPLLLEYIISP